MAKTYFLTIVKEAQLVAASIYNQSDCWRETGEVYNVSKGVIYGFVMIGRIPVDISLQVALGIRCRYCHGKHLPQICPVKYKPIQRRTKEELLWSLENRREM
ncbi:MAG: hypothetical protein RTU30_05355 [Candidatus Thorarchaeota archaeon]